MPKNSKVARKSTRKTAGLEFHPGRDGVRALRKGTSGKLRISKQAGIAQAAVLEYMCAEILELSGNATKDNKKRQIKVRHIQLAIRNDEELSKVFKNVDIKAGGVIPNLHPALLKKQKA